MKINLKKLATVLASTSLIGSTMALGFAANYPGPFVQNGQADVAVVYGSNPATAATDLVAVTDITSDLQAALASQTASGGGGTTTTVSGEAYPLFTSSTPLLLNASIASVRTSVTDANLPTILADSTFSGNVEAKATHSIVIGGNRVRFAQEPSSSDDPSVGVVIGTTVGGSNVPAAGYLYNATVTFNKAVNFTHADSEGEDITLFGQDFTVAAATDGTNIVLLKSSQTVTLSSDDPSAEVTVDGETYTIELISSSDDAATIQVTDSSGANQIKEISEDASKTTQGLEVGVKTADETNLKLTATLTVGANRLKLTPGEEIKVGTNEDSLDGTTVHFGSEHSGNITKLTFQAFAPSGSEDFISPGNSFVDPVFGTFKIDYSGLNVDRDDTSRETFSVGVSGNDKAHVSLSNWQGDSISNFEWFNNESSGQRALLSSDGSSKWPIVVQEMGQINESAYAIVGNEENGYFIRVKSITNSSAASTASDASKDKVVIENVFDTSQTWEAVITTSEGQGTIDIGGQTYTIYYIDDRDGDNDEYVRLDYPDSTSNDMVVFPTFETAKGAKFFFYKPLNISWDSWDGRDTSLGGNKIRFPDGKGYTDVTATLSNDPSSISNLSIDGGLNNITGLGTEVLNATIGTLTYSFRGVADGFNQTDIYLLEPDSGALIQDPALVWFEEEDEVNVYEAFVVIMGGGGTSNNGVGVSDVDFTWGNDAQMDNSGTAYGASGLQLESNDDLYEMMDVWGTIVTTDRSTSDQYTVEISYPDDQVTSLLYVAETDASISSSGTSGSDVRRLGSVAVSDSETSSVSGKNWIVVGGSCINKAAADLLGGTKCGSAFESATGVGAGSFLIETFSRASGKVATVAAGYNAGDTTNAAKYLTTQTVDTTAGMKYIGTSATSATLQASTA